MPASKPTADIPYQHLLQEDYFHLYRLSEFEHELSTVPHRHDFFMILWGTQGAGKHLIDFKAFDIIPGRVFFMRTGQVHQMLQTLEDGWLLVFNQSFFLDFIKNASLEEQFPLLDYFNQSPFVDLGKDTVEVYFKLLDLIRQELQNKNANMVFLQHYLYLMLLHANQVFQKQHQQKAFASNQLGIIRELKNLLEKFFREEHEFAFYAQTLGISDKKLNQISKESLGKTVHQLIQERLLTESKYLLKTTSLSMKEIAYDLGFADPAYFGRFFKKYTSLSPAAFRDNPSG